MISRIFWDACRLERLRKLNELQHCVFTRLVDFLLIEVRMVEAGVASEVDFKKQRSLEVDIKLVEVGEMKDLRLSKAHQISSAMVVCG